MKTGRSPVADNAANLQSAAERARQKYKSPEVMLISFVSASSSL
jgi:hypothetical protein